MYTEVKSYQIIISMFKKYGIKHCVLSSGSRNLPFVHSVEQDPYFKCYSVVDERSAGYFAMGLAQELNEPVVISCTSSTATCNYWPPVAEAFYQKVPLVVLTSDRDPEMLGQWEDQMIDQVGMYDRHVKKSVNLPIINNRNDEIFCERLLNEALLELDRNGGTGPVHINVPTNTYNRTFNQKSLPDVRKIDRFFYSTDDKIWLEKVEKLKKTNRILVTCGQKSYVSDGLKNGIREFFKKFNAAVIVDYMSNVEFEYGINTTMSMDARYVSYKKGKELLPDLVISFGGQVFSGVKVQLKNNPGLFDHWHIQEDGAVVDLYRSLTTVFECTPEYFFNKINSLAGNDCKNNMEYYGEFRAYNDAVVYPEFKYCGIYAIKNVVEKIPENSILHLSINDSIRITNFFKLNKNIKTYANIGTHGIDGCMSSFFGQACASPDKPAFLVIGDLSFFYDMNSLKINCLPNNIHILLVNNHGGSEFYFNSIQQGDDRHTPARHNTRAEGWVKENNFRYLSAHDKESYDKNLEEFLKTEDKPVIFEVFTEMSTDAALVHEFFGMNRPKDIKSEVVRGAKEFVKKSFGQERAKIILNALKK